MRIGLLEDDLNQIEQINLWLSETGDHLHSYETGSQFRAALNQQAFDLLILDWHLPDTTGLDELDWLRTEKGIEIPVIFITSRDNEESVVKALEHGADDYIVKPVNKNIALARIKALQRRHQISSSTEKTNNAANQETDQQLVIKPYKVDTLERRILLNDEAVKLTNKEYELATYLFTNAGCLISRETLMSYIWGTKADLNTRTVDTHISKIRSKLKINPANGWQLSSIYQRGYRLFPVVPE
ncbi:MAG: response regulator transcription factor [Gammaproteobacteria bacterium]|nr:response regulator transcription factor [Gammaproteobacteria bacterium]